MFFHVMFMKLLFQLHDLPVYDLSSENYWTVRASNWKIYWPGRKFTVPRENLLARE